MARPAKRFHLKTQDRKAVKELLSGGVQQVRVVLRGLTLLQLDSGPLSAPGGSQNIGFAASAVRARSHSVTANMAWRGHSTRSSLPGHAELLGHCLWGNVQSVTPTYFVFRIRVFGKHVMLLKNSESDSAIGDSCSIEWSDS